MASHSALFFKFRCRRKQHQADAEYDTHKSGYHQGVLNNGANQQGTGELPVAGLNHSRGRHGTFLPLLFS
jgi:hypothetical protein